MRTAKNRVVDKDGRTIEPAVGLCNRCETEVELGKFTNTCPRCGLDYNWAGQQLAPRECWGEETGEHWSECVEPPGLDEDCEEA